MNGAVIFQEAMRDLMRHELPDVTRRDVVAGLEAGRTVLPPIYAAVIETELAREEQLMRALAVYYSACAGNVADDVADGDCDYFEPGVPVATTVQYLLHTMSFEAALRTSVPREALLDASRELVQAAAWEPIELRTKVFDRDTYLNVARAMGGRQWRAHLRVLWAGTPLDDQVGLVADAVALASFVALDLAGSDRRLMTLPAVERQEIISFARSGLLPALAMDLAFVRYVAAGVDAALSSSPEGGAS